MPQALITMLLAGACLGDADGSGTISGDDFLAMHRAFGARYGETRYDPLVDWNADGVIDGADFLLLQSRFNQACRRMLSRETRDCRVEWAPGAFLPSWPAGQCVRVPWGADFTPRYHCPGWDPVESVPGTGECSG